MTRSARIAKRRSSSDRRQSPIDLTETPVPAGDEPGEPSAGQPSPSPSSVTLSSSSVARADESVDRTHPGFSMRWSQGLAELLLRLPLTKTLDRRLAPLINRGRLDQSDAIAGLLRFGLMGGLATSVYFAIAIGLHQTGLGPNTTSAIAIAISVVVSFVVQSRVTFQTGRFEPKEAGRFLVVGLIGLTVSRVVISTVHLRAEQPFWVAALVVCLVVPITNFTAMNFWVFASDRGGQQQ